MFWVLKKTPKVQMGEKEREREKRKRCGQKPTLGGFLSCKVLSYSLLFFFQAGKLN